MFFKSKKHQCHKIIFQRYKINKFICLKNILLIYSLFIVFRTRLVLSGIDYQGLE